MSTINKIINTQMAWDQEEKVVIVKAMRDEEYPKTCYVALPMLLLAAALVLYGKNLGEIELTHPIKEEDVQKN